MVSLLVLSMVLSAPAAAAPNASAQNSSAAAPAVQSQGGSPQNVVEEPPQTFDPITGQPDGAICYKIRTYLFTQGSNPKLIRETTCGPNRPTAKTISKPKFVPLDVKVNPNGAPEK